MKMKEILTIVGPTAAGKTKIALEIALRINGEVISADSRQIYKYLNIGTAKPTPEEQKKVKFHLIDFLEPDVNYSCGQFARDAERLIEDISNRGRRPIICGGTGLYIKALFNPLHPLPVADRALKLYLQGILKEKGLDYLYKRLLKIDPEWAKKIGPKDKQRILRGLEVYEITKKPLSVLIKQKREKARFRPRYIGITIPREELYKRINERYDRMIEDGLIDEAKNILKMGYAPDCYGLRTIGYKEIVEYLKSQCDLNEAIEKAKQHTRNFAKRQLTWFRKTMGVKWFKADEEDIIITEKILHSL